MRYAFFLVALTIAGSAFAEPAQEVRANLGGPVDAVCLFSGITSTGSEGTNVVILPNGASVEFRRFVDPQTALPLAISLNVRFVSVCNFSHRLKVTSRDGGIARVGGGTPSNGFDLSRNYLTQVSWAGGQSQFTTSGTAGEGLGFDVLGASSGGFDLNVSAPSGSSPLLAGNYADVLTIEVSGMP